MEKSISIAILCMAGTNTGDNAILLSALESIKKIYAGEIDFKVICPDPAEAKINCNIHNIEYVKITNPFKVLRSILKSSVFLFGGGGLITDDYNYRETLELSLTFLAKLFRKKVVVFFIGVDMPHSAFGKKFVKLVFEKTDLIITRDSKSQFNLQQMGVIKTKIISAADLTLTLSRYLDTYPIEQRRSSKIAVQFRRIDKFGRSSPLNEIVKLCDYLIEKYNTEVVFLPFSWHKTKEHSNDLEFALNIKKCMKNKERFEILDVQHPIETLKAVGRYDGLIGMRYHSLIFAAMNNIPMIGIAYDQKVRNFMGEIGLSKYCVDLNDFSYQVLINLLLLQKSDNDLVKSYSSLYEMRQKIGSALKELKNLMN